LVTIHFFLESFSKPADGMAESASRVVASLMAREGVQIEAYLLSQSGREEIPPPGIHHTHNLFDEALLHLQPIRKSKFSTRLWNRDIAQLFAIMGRNKVLRAITSQPKCKHIIVSFCVSSAGFVAQLVACDLQVPHIACARGSDLGRDLFSQRYFETNRFVAQNATLMIVTNRYHADLLERVCGRNKPINLIYNAIPKSVSPIWERRGMKSVHIVSATGLSIKKGTMLLLRAFKELLDDGLPVLLSIVGPVDYGDWGNICHEYVTACQGKLTILPSISQTDLKELLLSSDLYCSASLSEGCSNATLLAFGLGMPIVSSRVGALPDISSGLDHIFLCDPGDISSLKVALRSAIVQILTGGIQISTDSLRASTSQLTESEELERWSNSLLIALEST
jgi:glycosyltransferase involved in cell wall biosynthesis